MVLQIYIFIKHVNQYNNIFNTINAQLN